MQVGNEDDDGEGDGRVGFLSMNLKIDSCLCVCVRGGGQDKKRKGFRKGLKHQTKGFSDIKVSDVFLLADLQPLCDSRRQCSVQAPTGLRERREGKRGKEEEKEAGSKEKVRLITLQCKLLS